MANFYQIREVNIVPVDSNRTAVRIDYENGSEVSSAIGDKLIISDRKSVSVCSMSSVCFYVVFYQFQSKVPAVVYSVA